MKEEKINYNGQIISAKKFKFGINNRAFKYGDSLFETIRVFDGKIPFLSLHFNRLMEGLLLLNYNIPLHFNEAFLLQEIYKLKIKKNHRIRLMIFREDGGFYSPYGNDFHFVIEENSIKKSKFFFYKKGLHVGLLPKKLLNYSPISHLKTGNSLPYILAGIEKQKNQWDDCFLMNHDSIVCEAISSNLFIYSSGKLITPPLSSGCIAGTMRHVILKQLGLTVIEKEFTRRKIKNADAILLTNAIQGIRWVEKFEDKTFQYPKIGLELRDKINQLIS